MRAGRLPASPSRRTRHVPDPVGARPRPRPGRRAGDGRASPPLTRPRAGDRRSVRLERRRGPRLAARRLRRDLAPRGGRRLHRTVDPHGVPRLVGCISLAGSMKVVLPDSSELELPDGASGLDAARAIGPKLAEQAVLIRANGRVQDLRLPLQDGEPIQILTVRDKDDPDALAVLRHSSAHLLAEAVTRLYPGVKLAIGPPIENGFYYDFDFPEPIREEDLEQIQAAIDQELAEGREWSRQEMTRDEARQRFAGDPYKLELVDTAEGDISLYTQGDFTDLCRGPHLQNSKPIKALKLTGLAGAYWRGDS